MEEEYEMTEADILADLVDNEKSTPVESSIKETNLSNWLDGLLGRKS
jgi:hypothetical protein